MGPNLFPPGGNKKGGYIPLGEIDNDEKEKHSHRSFNQIFNNELKGRIEGIEKVYPLPSLPPGGKEPESSSCSVKGKIQFKSHQLEVIGS